MIYLYGDLRKKFGKTIRAKVSSVAELIKAAEANRPGFMSHIKRDRGYIIRRGDDFRTGRDIDESELTMRFGDTAWHVLPMPAGHSGVTRLLLGAVIVAVGAVMAYTGNPYGANVMMFGGAMMVGGAASMLAPAPSVNYGNSDKPDERASFLFNGPTNRTAPGGAVPLVFGRDVFVGSVFLSGGLNIGDIA